MIVVARSLITMGAKPSEGSSIMSSLGLGHHRPGDRHHLLLTAAQAAGSLAQPLLAPWEQLEDLFQLRL